MDIKTFRRMAATLLLAMLTTAMAVAQQIQTVDKNGNPVAYASVMTEDAKFLGATGLDGVLQDVKGAKKVIISHVAYQPKTVEVGHGGKITLEEADFDLPEVTVTKKPLVYVQTYYRVLAIDDDGLIYYRAGLVDNQFNRQKKNLSADEDHFSMASIGMLKTVLNMIINPMKNRLFGVRKTKLEDAMKRGYADTGLKITTDASGKTIITDNYGKVGTITDDLKAGIRRVSYNAHELSRHTTLATGKEKKIKKLEKREAERKNRIDVDFEQYRYDGQSPYSPEDFMMRQIYTSYDKENEEGKMINRVIMYQAFNTERAYVTKDELKKLKKQNKMKMTYDNLQRFEREHKIPALAPAIQKRLDDLAVKKK